MSTSAQAELPQPDLEDPELFDSVYVELVPVNDQSETDEDAVEEAPQGPLPRALAVLKSPIGMGAGGILLVAAVAGIVLGSGLLGGSKADEAAEQEIALNSAETSDLEKVTDAPSDKVDESETAEAYDELAADQEKKPAAPEYGQVTYSSSGAMFHTSPTTVSLEIDGAPAQLTLSLGILVAPEDVEVLKAQGLTINLLTIEAAQSVNYGPYLEWELPGLITKALKQRLEEAFPDVALQGVLIRDFQFKP